MFSDSAGICFYTASDTKRTVRFYLVGTFFTNREVSLPISFKTKQLNAVSPPAPTKGNLHVIIFFFFFTLHHAAFEILVPQPGLNPETRAVLVPCPNH